MDYGTALGKWKAPGMGLGSARPEHWRGREDKRAEGQRRTTARAAEIKRAHTRGAYSDLLPVILDMSTKGCSLQQIANALNADWQTTQTGRPFGRVQVKRILDRQQL